MQNCSLGELALALEAFGTLSVRDLKLLRQCSAAFATVKDSDDKLVKGKGSQSLTVFCFAMTQMHK